MHLYVATSNLGKLRDFAYAAAVHLQQQMAVQIEPLPGLASIAPPPEDGPTFEANARSKAIYYSRLAPGLPVLADDSGLEVDALGGKPGVRSARYAEDEGYGLDSKVSIDQRNNELLVSQIERLTQKKSRARYRCVLALARDGNILTTQDGVVEGWIVTSPRGEHGFGYDPIFLLPELDRTMAELDPTTRLNLSHRGRALRKLLEAGFTN
jgi:XTP/dITP diphosphohydrolase